MHEQIVKIIKVNTECDEDISENSLLSQLAIDSLTFIKIVIPIGCLRN